MNVLADALNLCLGLNPWSLVGNRGEANNTVLFWIVMLNSGV